MALAPGDTAPDFTLLTTPDQKISLSEFDEPVVLIFYPADWSPVCGDELTMFEAASRLFPAETRLQLYIDNIHLTSDFTSSGLALTGG